MQGVFSAWHFEASHASRPSDSGIFSAYQFAQYTAKKILNRDQR